MDIHAFWQLAKPAGLDLIKVCPLQETRIALSVALIVGVDSGDIGFDGGDTCGSVGTMWIFDELINASKVVGISVIG